MVMNVRRPGFQLLSLAPEQLRDGGVSTYKDVPCLLPDQLRIYLNIYLPLLAVSIIFVCLTSNVNCSVPGRRSPSGEKTSLSSSSSSSSSSLINSNHGDSDKLSPDNISTSRSLPTPIIATHRSTRSRGSRGWRIFSQEDQDQRPHISPNYLKVLRYSFWSVRSLLNLQRQRRRRQGWLITSLRNIRDIAVFPLGAFVIITWWVVAP
jgi:ethanolamine phosphate phosphodiesterase